MPHPIRGQSAGLQSLEPSSVSSRDGDPGSGSADEDEDPIRGRQSNDNSTSSYRSLGQPHTGALGRQQTLSSLGPTDAIPLSSPRPAAHPAPEHRNQVLRVHLQSLQGTPGAQAQPGRRESKEAGEGKKLLMLRTVWCYDFVVAPFGCESEMRSTFRRSLVGRE